MMKKAWKNTSLLLLVTTIVCITLVGCSSKKSTEEAVSPAASTGGAATVAPKKDRTEVNFWYLWNGKEAESLETLITEFNASQDLYTVKGLSVPDVQKIVVALSTGNGPDITDNFSSNTASYAEKGILEPLDEYIKRDNYDVSDFVPAALKSGQYKDVTYALPININFNMMFYNKKLFADAGITAPPTTDKELLDAAIKLTQVNDDKTIKVLGFPDFPFVYYVNPMTFAMGGELAAADGTLTPNNPGSIAAINLIKSYREKFGLDNIIKFNSSAKYLDATDPFISGKQAIRFDGPWFGNTVKNGLKIEGLDYGIAPLPGPDGKPELAGGGEIQTSTFFIAKNSKNKDGGWAFLSWLMAKPQMVKFNTLFGNLPSRSSVYDDPALQAIPDFKVFAEAAKNPNLKSFPSLAVQAEYATAFSSEFELAANGKKTAEEAMKAVDAKAKTLK
ncbi:ABC transporter substrate-binding protein [Paenibacillus psychroresistens]|uniref:ABC transporter substrate-binding protein n=1 Tax=Paenibacillus psychroresistens TaxID=1778678 RepID=A0A6B8REH5_9BACL|nr:ABC transporter substrate-binding protein [Paenibacillus psychroresistens]QGQ93913.1 ABC transporter substrate-binding protein [Paenibacillus psychroresistens]